MPSILNKRINEDVTPEQIARDLEDEANSNPANTHINAYIQDFNEALIKAHNAINELESKHQALLTRLGL